MGPLQFFATETYGLLHRKMFVPHGRHKPSRPPQRSDVAERSRPKDGIRVAKQLLMIGAPCRRHWPRTIESTVVDLIICDRSKTDGPVESLIDAYIGRFATFKPLCRDESPPWGVRTRNLRRVIIHKTTTLRFTYVDSQCL